MIVKNRIKKHNEFQEVIARGNLVRSKFFSFYILKNELGYTRIGISVPKKSGNAVIRNKIKRQIRAMCARNCDYSKSIDLVFLELSISIFGTEEGFRGENRTSYTSLVVSVDKNKVSHNSLQLNVDKFAMVYSDEIVFSHSGIIGGFKCSDVISRVRNYSNQLKITNGNIQLGAIKKNKILYLDDSDMTNFIYLNFSLGFV